MYKLNSAGLNNVRSLAIHTLLYLFFIVMLSGESSQIMWIATRFLKFIYLGNIYMARILITHLLKHIFAVIGILVSYRWTQDYISSRLPPLCPNQKLLVSFMVLLWYFSTSYRI